jgi:hypothetical protein
VNSLVEGAVCCSAKSTLSTACMMFVPFELFTRRMLQQAGVAQGMRVLDVGSGNGDVALLGAPLVGPYNLSDAAQSALALFGRFNESLLALRTISRICCFRAFCPAEDCCGFFQQLSSVLMQGPIPPGQIRGPHPPLLPRCARKDPHTCPPTPYPRRSGNPRLFSRRLLDCERTAIAILE